MGDDGADREGFAETTPAEVDAMDYEHGDLLVAAPEESNKSTPGLPKLRLIITAVAEDPEVSTATVYTEDLHETSIVHPGQFVPTPDEIEMRDGGVAYDDTETILEPGTEEEVLGEFYPRGEYMSTEDFQT